MATNDPFAAALAPTAQKSSAPSYFDQAKAIGDSAQVQAVTGTFDESKGAAGRVNQITDYGGPLMTAARTRSRQASVRSGLQNTSTAAQAGEQAVIETATPIATADAQLYQNQQLANQTAQNNAALASANIRAQTGIAGMNLGENARQFDTGLSWDKDKTGMSLMEQKRQFDATLGLQGRQLDQNQTQFDATMGLEKDKLGINQSQFQQTLGLEGQKLSMADQQFKANLDLQRENLAAQREQFAQKLGLDTAQLQLSRDQLGQQDRQFLAELDQRDAQLAQQESQFVRDQQNKVTLANLDATNRENLIKIEAGYKTEIAGNENISRAWGTMMDSINQIQNNPELDQSAKSTLISNTQAAFQSFANFWKKVSGGTADVSDLLAFQPVSAGGSGGGSSYPGGVPPNQYYNPGGNSGYVPTDDRGG